MLVVVLVTVGGAVLFVWTEAKCWEKKLGAGAPEAAGALSGLVLQWNAKAGQLAALRLACSLAPSQLRIENPQLFVISRLARITIQHQKNNPTVSLPPGFSFSYFSSGTERNVGRGPFCVDVNLAQRLPTTVTVLDIK